MSGNSSHGGAREGAGRKPKFRTANKSVSIRVPVTYRREMQSLVEIIDELIAKGFKIKEIRDLLEKKLKQ